MVTHLMADFNLEMAKEVANRPQNINTPAWGALRATCLTANYPGKMKDLADENAARENAPLIEDGEVIELEGEKFIAHVINRRVADPIHFKRVA